MTDTTTRNGSTGTGALLAAALALPGVLPSAAQAQVTVPNATLVQFKYLYYKDYQESGDRMRVSSPALYMLAPISEDWVFEIGAVYDNISGASPYYHTVLSGASGQGIEDQRTAADITVTKYFGGRTAVSLRAAYSTEDDYTSNAAGLTVRHATADQNTTFTAGVGYSSDEIFPTRWSAVHRAQEDRRLRGRRDAGSVRERHRPVQPVLREAERIPDRPVQGLLGHRQPSAQPRSMGRAVPLEPLLRRPRRLAAVLLPLLQRRLEGEGAYRPVRMGAGAQGRLDGHPQPSLHDAERRRVLLRPGLRSAAGRRRSRRDTCRTRPPTTPATSASPPSVD